MKLNYFAILQISFKGTVAVSCRISTEALCSSGNKTCLHHCCPLHQFHDSRKDNGLCEQNKGHGIDPSWLLTSIEDADPSDYDLLYDSLECNHTTYNLSLYQWEFFPNGNLKIASSVYQPKDYCLNDIEDFDSETGTYKYWHEVQVCIEADGPCQGDYKAWDCLVNQQILPAVFCLSMIFFGLLALYIWLKKKEKLFECMMISNIAMLFLVYAVLTVDKITGSFYAPHPIQCEVRGLLIQFGFISSLFWLSSMSHLSK